ncbi:MAG: 6,7-dimethyl-8-ribityllumazine synthase [Gemmatimonadales bacterium]
MPEFSGRLRPVGRVALLVSRYNEMVTGRLLEGARQCCAEAGIAAADVDVFWVAGAFELPTLAEALARSARYRCLVALGAVIRGDTPHFEYVAGEAARGLAAVARSHALPVGFGLLTVENLDQALDRAGGKAGNKGYEAADAALRAADLVDQLRDHADQG